MLVTVGCFMPLCIWYIVRFAEAPSDVTFKTISLHLLSKISTASQKKRKIVLTRNTKTCEAHSPIVFCFQSSSIQFCIT